MQAKLSRVLTSSVIGGLITNNGTVVGPATAQADVGIEITNTVGGVISKASGNPYAIDLLGNGGRNFFDDGTIIGDVHFGNGWDSMQNSGLVQGTINMGNGNNRLVNQIILGIDGGETTGTVTGKVSMGQGDDAVLNLGSLVDVNLGGGNDSYSVTDQFSGDLNVSSGTAGNVNGAAGNDELSGGTVADKFYGGSDNDTLSGNGGKDQLFGNNGNDLIFGGDGNDKINGGASRDTNDGGNNNDQISSIMDPRRDRYEHGNSVYR